MDQDKVNAGSSWPTHVNIKDVQRFIGFANFYRRFIQGFSTIATPLTALLKNKPRKLTWTPAAEKAFTELKKAFTSAPIQDHPDLSKPFIVEVDASERGVVAVLSQRLSEIPA